jgi:hypothetical protein
VVVGQHMARPVPHRRPVAKLGTARARPSWLGRDCLFYLQVAWYGSYI